MPVKKKSKKTLARHFEAACDVAVQWRPDGGLSILYVPMIEDKNPFFFNSAHGYIDLKSAADAVINDFLVPVGTMYKRQFERLPEEKRRSVSFPPVRFRTSVNCRVDTRTKTILTGKATAEGKAKGLDDKTRSFRSEKSVNKMSVDVYGFQAVHEPNALTLSWEQDGHEDPNCGFSWTGCTCKGGPCCAHIVQPWFSRLCYREKCQFSIFAGGCACFRDSFHPIPCPESKSAQMATWRAQLQELDLKASH